MNNSTDTFNFFDIKKTVGKYRCLCVVLAVICVVEILLGIYGSSPSIAAFMFLKSVVLLIISVILTVSVTAASHSTNREKFIKANSDAKLIFTILLIVTVGEVLLTGIAYLVLRGADNYLNNILSGLY